MIFVNHTDACASKPVAGQLTGKCNCKSAPLTVRAHKQIDALLARMAAGSIKSGEPAIYFAIRLEQLSEVLARRAKSARRTAKRSDRNLKLNAKAAKAAIRSRKP